MSSSGLTRDGTSLAAFQPVDLEALIGAESSPGVGHEPFVAAWTLLELALEGL